MSDKVEISAIHLSTVGDYVLVAVECEGRWVEVIREFKDNAYSHIVEAHGIAQASSDARFIPNSRNVRRALRGELGKR